MKVKPKQLDAFCSVGDFVEWTNTIDKATHQGTVKDWDVHHDTAGILTTDGEMRIVVCRDRLQGEKDEWNQRFVNQQAEPTETNGRLDKKLDN